jgi:hypothetical protein
MDDVQSIGGMPINQANAHTGPELVMRVGIPHKGGRLAFHAFEESYAAMVSANAFFDYKTHTFKIPKHTDLEMLDYALDSAGFTAVSNFQKKGRQRGIAGVFPWSYAQYIELANTLNPSWWAQPDLCCEPEIAGSQAEIDYRVNATATMLEATLRIVFKWQEQLAETECPLVIANMIRPPVPVIQGWSADDYKRSLELLMDVWQRWEPWIAPPALIGLGSVCRRDLHHPTHGLFAILAALEPIIPKGSHLHCFGVKGAAIRKIKMMKFIASSDSMGWDAGARIKAHKAGVSNTMLHRSNEMTAWMSKAQHAIMPQPGDQFRMELF